MDAFGQFIYGKEQLCMFSIKKYSFEVTVLCGSREVSPFILVFI